MLNLKILSASEYCSSFFKGGDKKKFYSLALEFVLKYEKSCCSLIQRIIHQDDSVYLIFEAGTEKSCSPEVYGAFTWNDRGRLIFSCLPFQNQSVESVLGDFFSSRPVFCISGEKNFADFLFSIIRKKNMAGRMECRNYFLMEAPEKSIKLPVPEGARIIQCKKKDLNDLLPLQVDYSKVEVLPPWRRVVPAAEMMGLQQSLTAQIMLAISVRQGDKTVLAAKANTNALSVNHFQIGGVYTMPEYRSRGYATVLVNRLALLAELEEKRAVLFVKSENISAIRAYTKAGFTNCGYYRIYYFEELKEK